MASIAASSSAAAVVPEQSASDCGGLQSRSSRPAAVSPSVGSIFDMACTITELHVKFSGSSMAIMAGCH